MNWTSEGIILACCVGAAYLFAFAYEMGFITTWSIPIEYLSINLSTFLLVASTILLVFVPFFFIWLLLAYSSQDGKPVLIWSLITAAFLISFLFIVMIFGYGWKVRRYESVILLTLLITAVLSCIILKRNIENYGNLSKVGAVCLAVMMLGYGIITFYYLGKRRAKNQVKFLIPENDPNIATLRIYGGNLICVPFDRKTKKIKPVFIVRKARDIDKLELKLEKVGPLSLEEE